MATAWMDHHAEIAALDDPKCELKDFKPWGGSERSRRATKTPVLENVKEALDSLASIDEESREEGFEPCLEESKQIARRFLKELAPLFSGHFDLYPTDNKEIAIELVGKTRTGVLVLIRPDGSASCFSTLNGKNARATYDDANDLPDAFVLQEVRKLDQLND